MNIVNGCAILRAIEDTDFDLLFEMVNSPEIEYQTGLGGYPLNSHEQKEWMKNFHNNDHCLRLVVQLTNGHSIGLVTLSNMDMRNGTAYLHYKVKSGSEGRMKGDIYDAVYGLLEYAFLSLRLNCIEGGIRPDNIMSLKLARKLGFKEEGLMRQRIYSNGEYHDLIPISILREEFMEQMRKKGDLQQHEFH